VAVHVVGTCGRDVARTASQTRTRPHKWLGVLETPRVISLTTYQSALTRCRTVVGSQDIQLGKCARAPDRRDDGRVRYVVIRRARLRIAHVVRTRTILRVPVRYIDNSHLLI
jgi:hypothetical protein